MDIRVTAATNTDLEKAVAEQRFRADLFYRLSVVVIRVPPLRERREDIPLLTEEFVRRACSRAGRQIELTPGALGVITAFDWPGNVRQLENLIERVVLLASASTVQPDDLPAPLNSTHRSVSTGFFHDLPTLDELERQYLQHVMEAVGGNRTRAAQVLGIDRRTLYRMAERFGLKLGEES